MRSFRLGFSIDFLSLSILILVFLSIVNGIIPQAEILIFGDYIFQQNLFFKAAIPVVILLMIVSSKNVSVNRPILYSSFVFIVYSLFTGVYQSSQLGLQYVQAGYNAFFYFIFVINLVIYTQGRVSIKLFKAFLLFFSFITSLVGFAQFVLNEPILNLRSPNGLFEVLSWVFYGGGLPKVRGFSLFSNALEAGIFLVYSIGLIVYGWATRSKIKYAFIFVIAVCGIVATLTRNVYLGAFIAILSSLLFCFLNKKRVLILYLVPIMSFAFGIAISQAGNLFSSGISDTQSLQIRSDIWRQEIGNRYNNNLPQLLFGEGLYQSETTEVRKKFLVDNTYIHTIIHQGVFGLLLLILFYSTLLRYTVSRSADYATSALYGFLVAWPAMSFYNIMIYQLGIYALLTILVSNGVGQYKWLTSNPRKSKQEWRQ